MFYDKLSKEASGAVDGMLAAMQDMDEDARDAILKLLEPILDETEMAKLELFVNGEEGGASYAEGVASKEQDSYDAGQTDAKAADKGAGSVDPTNTGAKFGQKLNSGVSGKAGALLQAGIGLGTSAKTGAGSVDPTGEGSLFGSRYSTGVVRKVKEALSGGTSLGTSAQTGASSVRGYTPGYNFGSGFVSGIGAWIGKAGTKAAELANRAYNSLKASLEERSPSRKTKRSGKNFDLGLAGGIEENAAEAVSAAEDVGEETLHALESSLLMDKIRRLDLDDIMEQAYRARDGVQERVSKNVIAATSAKEDLMWRSAEKESVLSDEDIRKLAKAFSSAAAEDMARALEGVSFVTNNREWARLIREAGT